MDFREEVQGLLRGLAEDNRSGASQIAIKAVEGLARVLPRIPAGEVPEAVDMWARGIAEAQPSMAPMYTVGREVLRLGEELRWAPRDMEDACVLLLKRLREAPQKAALVARGVLKDAGVVVTYSKSSQVMLALKAAHEVGADFRVVLSEGRPMLEGVDAAMELAGLGVRVRLVVDAALPQELEGADLLLVGADAVGPSGLVNKVGTRTLVAEAKRLRVPAYAVCSSEKWLGAGDETRLRVEERDPAEVLRDPPPGIEVSNRYFDRTPLEWFSGIMGEEQIYEPHAILETLRTL